MKLRRTPDNPEHAGCNAPGVLVLIAGVNGEGTTPTPAPALTCTSP